MRVRFFTASTIIAIKKAMTIQKMAIVVFAGCLKTGAHALELNVTAHIMENTVAWAET